MVVVSSNFSINDVFNSPFGGYLSQFEQTKHNGKTFHKSNKRITCVTFVLESLGNLSGKEFKRTYKNIKEEKR